MLKFSEINSWFSLCWISDRIIFMLNHKRSLRINHKIIIDQLIESISHFPEQICKFLHTEESFKSIKNKIIIDSFDLSSRNNRIAATTCFPLCWPLIVWNIWSLSWAVKSTHEFYDQRHINYCSSTALCSITSVSLSC